MGMNQVLTQGRMHSLINCPRAHFWAFEIGLTKDDYSIALFFGSAWHRGMEARWQGLPYEDALAYAIPEGITELDKYACATLAALLAGYYDYYGETERVGKLLPEIQFDEEIEGTSFRMHGKIDGLGKLKTGRNCLVESKTTGDGIEPDSDYWMRLRFNIQVYHYYDAACKRGQQPDEVIYDVCRKPSIRPKEVTDLDEQGRKIVVDAQGKRVFAKMTIEEKVGKGKKAKVVKREIDNPDKPAQSASKDKGWEVKTHTETPDEYSDRLWRDTLARPSFYFARKEVPILDGDFQQFINQRLAMCKLIEHFRSQERFTVEMEALGNDRDQEAWPRNVSNNTCTFCKYKPFCLSNLIVDINNPPQGFTVKPFNPELNYATAPTEATAVQ